MAIKGYFDADGHVLEAGDEIQQFLDEPYLSNRGGRELFPAYDQFHGGLMAVVKSQPGTFVPADSDRWLSFLDKTGTDATVLFPTRGLFFGRVTFPEYATAYARAYNSWLAEKYVKVSPRLNGVALLPMQDVPSAVAELRRAVTELGMVGGMLPSNGLQFHLGAKAYWPVYEAAQELGCVLAVHGGNYEGLGFDTLANFPASRALGMPAALLNSLTGMIVEGVLDEYPNLRVGFLEGGTAWIPGMLDRLAREVEYSGLPLNRDLVDYFTSGQVFVSCEGNEESLSYSIARVGPEPFMFASDFPHEISMDNAMEEIDEINERDDLQEEHKQMILGENARRFYGI
jgi:predicted TIM-barrel fold metal-dependent hydrolase